MEEKLTNLSPQSLAFVGDAVYELLLRTRIVQNGSRPAKQLQKESSRLARAGAQAAIYEKLQPFLTEEEKDIARRGRNAHPGTVAKHATVAEYRRATGLEALIGALYLQGNEARIGELLAIAWEETEE